MAGWFKKLWRSLGAESSLSHDTLALADYRKKTPGFPNGIAVFELADLLASHQDTIKQIVLARGLGGRHNDKLADAWVHQPIRRLAELCHLLPASKGEYFNTAGGLFEMCLEIALLSILAAEQRILTRATPEIRKTTEDLWTHAAFLNGLFSEAVAVLSTLSVFSPNGNAQWNPSVATLYAWLRQQGLKEYQFKWDDAENRPKIHVIASQCIDTAQVEILSKGDWVIFNTLLGALHNPKDFSNPLAKINDQVKYNVIERDLKTRASNYGKPLSGMHLQPWLIDAMRGLVQRGKWQPNTPNGRVWHGLDGIFLVWPLASNDIKIELKEAGCPFVPTTSEIMAEMMIHAQIILLVGVFHDYVTTLLVPSLETGELRPMEAIKLCDPLILFPKGPPEPLAMHLSSATLNSAQTQASDSGPTEAEAGDGMGSSGYPEDNTHWDDPDYAMYAAATESDRLAVTQENPPPEQAAAPAPANNQSGDDDWLSAVVGKASAQKKPALTLEGKPAKAVLTQLMARLNAMPPEYITLMPDGVVKFGTQGLAAVKLEIKPTVDILKSAGWLVPVNGLDTGLEGASAKSRFFLVKETADVGQ